MPETASLDHHVRERTNDDAVGNRSLLFRDPDCNLVNPFNPITAVAIEEFASYVR